MDFDLMQQKSIEWMVSRGWKQLLAKRHEYEQSLFEHTKIEIDAAAQLLPILERKNHFALTEDEKKILFAALIAHDVGKEKPEWQAYIQGKRQYLSHVDPELTKNILPGLCKALEWDEIEDSVLKVIENCVNLHMKSDRSDAHVVIALLQGGNRWKTLADLVDALDNICSAKGVFNAMTSIGKGILANHIEISYHQVNIRGVSTTMLHRAAVESFIKKGWRPLIYYSDSTLYASSAADNIIEPTVRDIEAYLAEVLDNALGNDVAELIVGSPVEKILPKPDLIDFTETKLYLQKAAKKIKRNRFIKKKERDKRKVVSAYLGKKPEEVTSFDLDKQSLRIDRAHPEMVIFKFFKALMDEKIVRKEGVKIAWEEYEKVFGKNSWKALQNTSTLMAARDMAKTVDYFWNLPGSNFSLRVNTIEELPDEKREELLINTLDKIGQEVFRKIEFPPSRKAITKKMAQSFIKDLVRPSERINLQEIVKAQLEAYTKSKPYAGKDVKKGRYLCPLCNSLFEDGVKASADFLDNPQSHTNRAVSHGSFDYLMICNSCYYERILRQILLGGKLAEMIVLFPRMNIGYGSGNILVQKARELYERAYNLMVGNSDDPGQQISLALTQIIAKNALNTDLYRLSPAKLVKILTYALSEENRKKQRRELERELKKTIGKTVEDLNIEWGTDFKTWDEAIDALIANRVDDSVAQGLRAKTLKLVPQLKVICQTPNIILIPTIYPIALGNESETNTGLRKLFVSLLIGLSLEMSVAIIDNCDDIDFEGGEGVAHVPPVSAVRELIGSNWVPVSEGEKWFRAIGAASLLTEATAYPERSNLYAILSAHTPGHILRRIEEKKEGRRQANLYHIQNLEIVKEVLR